MIGLAPARRLLALFAAYEALPYNAEFVDQAIKPLIEAELQAYVRNPNLRHYAVAESFVQYATELWGQLQCRGVTVVHDLKISLDREAYMLTIQYQLFSQGQEPKFIKIPLVMDSMAHLDNKIFNAQERLALTTRYLEALP